MKALLLYPRFPQTFWSYNRFMEMAGLKASIPLLGIITVASLLPEDWEIRFHDRNVTEETDADWEWCDIVIISAMLAQKQDFLAQIQKAVQLGKKVGLCAAREHFWEYRALARQRITQQISYDPLRETALPEQEPALVGG
jgi:radical SAM superfamily enzyme YgiQ (UPF0313 family)